MSVTSGAEPANARPGEAGRAGERGRATYGLEPTMVGTVLVPATLTA